MRTKNHAFVKVSYINICFLYGNLVLILLCVQVITGFREIILAVVTPICCDVWFGPAVSKLLLSSVIITH